MVALASAQLPFRFESPSMWSSIRTSIRATTTSPGELSAVRSAVKPLPMSTPSRQSEFRTLVPARGFEPRTLGLKGRCSATELHRRPAESTRDPPACFARGMKPPETHTDLLERPVFAHMGTVTSDGAPLVNPMWFLWDPDAEEIKLTHITTRHNYRYMQREPRIALSIADPDDQYRYLQVRGVIDRIERD